MCMVRSPKSSAGAVEVALGNAPYKIAENGRSIVKRSRDGDDHEPRGLCNGEQLIRRFPVGQNHNPGDSGHLRKSAETD